MKLIQVSTQLYRGSRPETVEDFNLLRASGISSVVCLQGNLLEYLNDEVAIEMKSIASYFSFFWIPLSSIWPPKPGAVHDILRLIRSRHGKVLVHCKEGVDRTGFVVAAYQLTCDHGCTYEQAKADMYRHGFHWWYFYWLPALRGWAR